MLEQVSQWQVCPQLAGLEGWERGGRRVGKDTFVDRYVAKELTTDLQLSNVLQPPAWPSPPWSLFFFCRAARHAGS